ncbi:MAG: hypothetical protein WA634_00400, partial [Silvibacterium sp.]
LLAVRRLFRFAVACATASVAPMTAYGVISMAKGWSFLPSSITLKGAHYRSVFGPILHALFLLIRAPSLLGILVLLIVMLRSSEIKRWLKAYVLLLLSVLVLLMHLATADVGWLYRYEAYLVGFSIIAAANALPLIKIPRFGPIWFLVLTTVTALGVRTSEALVDIPQMSEVVYCQPYQMARFVARYYPRASIALNDIGEVDYVSDIHLLDLAGLADPKIALAKNKNVYTTSVIRDTSVEHDTLIAIVHESWFPSSGISYYGPPLPASWHCAGQWYSTGPFPLGDRVLSFYAALPGERERLARNLREFAPQLPKETLYFPC